VDGAKRTMIRHDNEDVDYEDGGIDDEAFEEAIEGSETDASDAKTSNVYTEKGIEQSLKRKAAPVATGEFVIRAD